MDFPQSNKHVQRLKLSKLGYFTSSKRLSTPPGKRMIFIDLHMFLEVKRGEPWGPGPLLPPFHLQNHMQINENRPVSQRDEKPSATGCIA